MKKSENKKFVEEIMVLKLIRGKARAQRCLRWIAMKLKYDEKFMWKLKRKAEQILSLVKAQQVIARIEFGMKDKGIFCVLKIPQVVGYNGRKCMEEFLKGHLKNNMIENAWLSFKVDFVKPVTCALHCATQRARHKS